MDYDDMEELIDQKIRRALLEDMQVDADLNIGVITIRLHGYDKSFYIGKILDEVESRLTVVEEG